MIHVEWCGLCNSKPADGKLLFQTDEPEPVELQTCEGCAKAMAEQSLIELKDITKSM